MPVVVAANEMKAGQNPLILRPTGRSEARKIGIGNCGLDHFAMTSLAHVGPCSSSLVLRGGGAVEDSPQKIKMQVARLPPREFLVVTPFVWPNYEDAAQMWMQRSRALQAGIGDDGPSRTKALFSGSIEGIESLRHKSRPVLLRQV